MLISLLFSIPTRLPHHRHQEGQQPNQHRRPVGRVLLGTGPAQSPLQHLEIQSHRGRGPAATLPARMSQRVPAWGCPPTVSSTSKSSASLIKGARF